MDLKELNMIIRDEKGNELLEIIKVDEAQAENLYAPITHALVVVKIGEEYLMGWNKWRQDWEIFGGCKEEGETIRECIVREAYEELGLENVEYTYLGLMKLKLAPSYFSSEWREEYGGLYGITLLEDMFEVIEKYRTDKEEIEKLEFYRRIKVDEKIAVMDEKLLEFWKKIEPAVKLLDKYNRPYDVVDTNFVKNEHSWKLMENIEMKLYEHKVQYYETDKMGIVHHSNYIRWMEEARIDFLSQIGWDYKKLEDMGIASPVTAVECKYKISTTFADLITICVEVEEFKGVKLKLKYEMKKDDVLVCEGHSEHCFLNTEGNIINLKREKPEFHNALTSLVGRSNF